MTYFFPLQRHLVCVCVTTMDPTPDTLSRVDSSHAVLFLSSSIVCKKRERGREGEKNQIMNRVHVLKTARYYVDVASN